MAKTKSLRCPSCGTIVLPEDENFPFCSDRCRLIDLGKWASGGYVISSPVTDPEEIEKVLEMRKQVLDQNEDDLLNGTGRKPN